MPRAVALWLYVSSLLLALAGGGRVAELRAAPATGETWAGAVGPIGRVLGRRAIALDARVARPTAAARRGRVSDETMRAGHTGVAAVVARVPLPPHIRATLFAPAAVASGLAARAASARAPAGAATVAHVVAARGALLPYYPTAPPFQS